MITGDPDMISTYQYGLDYEPESPRYHYGTVPNYWDMLDDGYPPLYVPDSDANYCVHGTYIGGIGRDHMCNLCELGFTVLKLQACGHYAWTDDPAFDPDYECDACVIFNKHFGRVNLISCLLPLDIAGYAQQAYGVSMFFMKQAYEAQIHPYDTVPERDKIERYEV